MKLEERDQLKICVTGSTMMSATSLNKSGSRPSEPASLLVSSCLRAFGTVVKPTDVSGRELADEGIRSAGQDCSNSFPDFVKCLLNRFSIFSLELYHTKAELMSFWFSQSLRAYLNYQKLT